MFTTTPARYSLEFGGCQPPTDSTIVHPHSKVPRDFAARRFWWHMGYLGAVNGTITSKMVKMKKGGERPPLPPQPAVEAWRLFIRAFVSCPSFLLAWIWFPRLFFLVLSFFLFLFFSFCFFHSLFICGVKEVQRGRVPGALRKKLSLPHAPVRVCGKVWSLWLEAPGAVTVDGFPVQLESISGTFAVLCISAFTPCAPKKQLGS